MHECTFHENGLEIIVSIYENFIVIYDSITKVALYSEVNFEMFYINPNFKVDKKRLKLLNYFIRGV